MKKALAVISWVLLLAATAFSQSPGVPLIGGLYNATSYNYGGQPSGQTPGALYVDIGNSSTGTATLTIRPFSYLTTVGGDTFMPFSVTAPILVDSGANQETVTPTAVSCSTPQLSFTCTITGSFLNTHGPGTRISSGSFGLQEAMNRATQSGGGMVVIDSLWNASGATNAIITAAVPYSNVTIEDRRGAITFWNVMPTTATAAPTPVALTSQAACDATHTFCSDATVAGSASWGGTVVGCITYVDINGNESACSPTASFTSVASKAIDIGPPAARTDSIIGWKPYLSLSGGSYALAYSLPLLTQPTVLLAVPVSSGVCTLTTLETTTPACALTNSTYGQTASAVGAAGLFSKGGAQFTTYPVVTNTLAPEIGSVSALQHNPNEEAHATYAYAPGGGVGTHGVQDSFIAFPITAAAQTTIGQVEATIPLPASFMNYVGRKVEVCGLIAKTSTVADTVDEIQVWWDAEGSNVTAGTPVQLSSIKITEATALAAAADFQFCQQFTTTVVSTSATGGTIQPGQGWATVSQVSAGANPSAGANALVAAVGSLNLALPAHISVELKHTTGTDGAGSILQGATLRVLN